MNFEDKIKQLENTVAKFEDDEIGLSDGIELFEQGLKITKDCLKELSEAKGKINIIKQEMDKLIDEPFNKD